MTSKDWGRSAAIFALGLAVVAGAATTVAGLILSDVFQPNAGVEMAFLSKDGQLSLRLRRWHRTAAMTFLSAAALSVLVLLSVGRRLGHALKRRVVVTAASATAVLTAALTIATRPLVEWDQLAIRSVTLGPDLPGYWGAAFSEDVRFIVINHTEVSQAAYIPALVAHLAAPVVGTFALVLAMTLLLTGRGPSR